MKRRAFRRDYQVQICCDSSTQFFQRPFLVRRMSRNLPPKTSSEPLGMKHMLFFDDHMQVVPNRAVAYDPGKDRTLLSIGRQAMTSSGRS